MSAVPSHDLVVVGGGIAGTMAVLTAVARGLDTAWIAEPVSATDQSAHWHGHLHRGRLYDPVREAALIEELGRNVAFWWSNAVVGFHADVETVALGADERWAAAFSRRIGRTSSGAVRPGYLGDDVAFVRTDEAVLDGPAFLAAATAVAETLVTRIDGRCTSLRHGKGRWTAQALLATGESRQVRAATTVIAAGTATADLLPPGLQLTATPDTRLSRMLVLRGALPPAAAIVPSRSAGGLFFASRPVPGATDEHVWLVSDGYSSPGTASPGALTDGWWICSVLERLATVVHEDLLAGLEVGGYLAPKSRLLSSPTQVPAQGFALDVDRSLVAMIPSKWSSSPTTAAAALDALLPDTVPAVARAAGLSDLLALAPAGARPSFAETWRSVDRYLPMTQLREPGLAALRAAALLLTEPHHTAAPSAVRAVA